MVKTKQIIETQAGRFQKTARELGCDEDESHFEKKLKRVVTAKTAKPAERKQKTRSEK